MIAIKESNPNYWVYELLNEYENNKYFGKLLLQYDNGRIVLIRKETTLKPPSEVAEKI